jgi:uncharacterized membrane protein YadS
VWVWVIVAALLVPLVWYGNPAVALLTGTALSLLWQSPLGIHGNRWGRVALQTAIVLLGLTLRIDHIVAVSGDSLWLVATYVLGVLGSGTALARLLRLERESGLLMTAGRRFGGTTIATLARDLARPDQVGVQSESYFC